MNVTKDYMCEAAGRAEALSQLDVIARRHLAASGHPAATLSAVDAGAAGETRHRAHSTDTKPRSESLSRTLLGDHSSKALIRPQPDDYIVHQQRKFEVTDLFNIFVGPKARTTYVVILSGYMYGALWAYSSVFAASFAANVPSIGGSTCNIEDGGADCKNIFHLWLGVFGLVAIPLACMELQEQVLLQVRFRYCCHSILWQTLQSALSLAGGHVYCTYPCGCLAHSNHFWCFWLLRRQFRGLATIHM
jgi:hypothetical protein